MKKLFKKNIKEKLHGQFQTDGKFFLFTIKELGLSGKGFSPKEAYEDLMDTWNKSYKLLGTDISTIDDNISLLNKEKIFLKIRNSILIIGLVLALLISINAALTPILDLPRTIRHGLLNITQTILNDDLGKISEKIKNMDQEKRDKLVNDISSILILVEDIKNKANKSSTK
tara:strand:- start:61 stop:573 length:513 start_codon:yes stop_codon:yes gene_type:complete